MNQVYGKNLDYFLKNSGSNSNYFIQTAASLGIVTDKDANTKTSTETNSPMTLNAGISYFPDSFEKTAVVAIGSISYMVSSDFEDAGGSTFSNNMKLDPEFAGSLYLHKSYTYRNVTGFFGGLDYESFNLYSAPSAILSNEIELSRERITYATLGLCFAQKLVTPFVLKLSASQSLINQLGLSGQRYHLHYEQKYSENTWYHFFAKRNVLSNGSRELRINRFGFGLGFYY